MRVSEAKELFRQLTSSYFTGAMVVFARQSRAAKTDLPLVSITPGNVKRHTNPVYRTIGDTAVGSYQSHLSMTVDLFTHGKAVMDDETNAVVAYEDTALDDMLAFADFLNSDYAVEWSHNNDVAIIVEGNVQNMSGLLNDNNYEYRSRLNVVIYFTQHMVGHAAVMSESSILFPTDKTDDSGQPIYTPEEPIPTSSSTNYSAIADESKENEAAIVVPVPIETSSGGGGTNEMMNSNSGYFNKVEIKEETGNE